MTLRKDGIDCMARVNAARDIFAALPGSWTRSWTEERLILPNRPNPYGCNFRE
jgi:hypothetical protein